MDMSEANRDVESKKFQHYEHASKLLRNLNESRHLPNLCDAVVLIGCKKIPVQKNILSAASGYFRAFYEYQQSTDPSKASSTVSLDHMAIDEQTFRLILDYIYTAEVKLDPDNIQDMLQAADELLMGDLKDVCCEYLNTCITPQNCIGIVDFTSRLSCTWWHMKVSQYLDANFREISQHEEFLLLEAARVEALLSKTTLQVDAEDELLEILLRWYRHDVPNRKSETIRLMRSVLCAGQLSQETMDLLAQQTDEGHRDVYNELVTLRSRTSSRSSVRRGFVKVIVVCGGEGPSLVEAGCFDNKDYVRCVPLHPSSADQQWVDLAPMSTPRTGHGLVQVGGFLYAAGGRDNNCRILTSCEKYDPFTNKWTTLAPMNHARVGFGFVAIENMIYAIGGSNDMTDPLTSMEVYDVCTGVWTPLGDMSIKRAWPCYVAAGTKIYVLGGGIIGKFYETVEVFDTRTQTWYAVSPMRERRCDARAVSVGDDLYVFGGFRLIECPSAAHSGNNSKLCGVEFYSKVNDMWMPLQSSARHQGMCVRGERSQVNGALYTQDEILIVGELDMNNGEVHAVRSFNTSTNMWEAVVVNLPRGQSRYQACMLDLPNSVFHNIVTDTVDGSNVNGGSVTTQV